MFKKKAINVYLCIILWSYYKKAQLQYQNDKKSLIFVYS